MTDPYAYWHAMLAHKADPKSPLPDFDKAHPETGFYRGSRDNAAIAIWWRYDESGKPVQCIAMVHRPSRTGGRVAVSNYDKADVISDMLFSYCCRNPISHEAYKAFTKSGVWPEDVNLPKPEPLGTRRERREGSREYYAEDRADAAMAKSIGEAPPNLGESEGESGTVETAQSRNESASPELTFSTEIDVVISEAEKYLNEIGRKVSEKVHADRLANYALVAGAVATRAEIARKLEKQPVLDAGRAIDGKWNPIVAKAERVAKNLKTLLVPYFNEQRKKAAQEAAEAQRGREAATLAGEVPPLAGARPSPTTAGTQGRVSLTSRKVYRITDLKAAAEFVAKLNDPPQEFIDGVLSAAQRLMKAGVEVPGVEVSKDDVVA